MYQMPGYQKKRACRIKSLFLRGCAKLAAAAMLVALLGASVAAQAQRVLGLDVSAWQGNLSVANWDTLKRATNQMVNGTNGDGRDFVIIRSSRGGTTGYYNQNDAGNTNGLNTLSQRYDDPYFVQNITRATAEGLLAGTYHFTRPDIIATTQNSGGIPNNGADEADHFIQMAGPWMRPGFLLPVHDFEAGDGIRTDDELAQFCIDFSDRIYAVMGIRPAIYINGNYAANILQTASISLRNQIVPAYPTLWTARWPNQADPNSILVQTAQPKDSYTPIYGPWDDSPYPANPWVFWQYASTARLNVNTNANIDVDVAQGGIEFVKDYLVPAIWVTNSDGQWTTLSNWNSGLTPIAPVQGPGQVARVGTLTLPVPRLPASNDTVILDLPGTNITVTLASGTHNIRKLYMRETLNITGGSLTVNYVPSPDSTTNAAQFSGPVTLSGSGSLSLHTLQVDAAQSFTLGGGTVVFNTINLMPHTTTPAKILVTGDVNLNGLSNVTAMIVKGAGSGNSGLIDLGGAARAFNVANGSAEVDVSVAVPITNGGLTKSGSGTLSLNLVNTYSGGTILSGGRLLVNNTNGSGTGSGGVTVNGGTLCGTGTISGAVTVNAGGTVWPGTISSMGKLTFNTAPTFNGTNFMRIDRNGGSSLADKIVLSSGTLNYGGTLVVSNAGAAPVGGDVFTNFAAGSYSGAFAATVLPSLGGGLNWYLGRLTTNGTIKVNRSPVTQPFTFTNVPPLVLQIPIASLTTKASDADGDPIAVTGIDSTTTNGITLLTNDTYILYSNYVSVIDQFNYTIGDGHGGSATGSVQIVSSPTGRFTGYAGWSGNTVALHFAGRPGWTYYLDRTTNLPVWVTVWTNNAPASGLFDFIDDFHDLSQPPSSAFYRLRWSP